MRKSDRLGNRTLTNFRFKLRMKVVKATSRAKRDWQINFLERCQLLSLAMWTDLKMYNNWGIAANWSGGVAPSAGDDLCFFMSLRTSTQNNLPTGLSFHFLKFQSNNRRLFASEEIILARIWPFYALLAIRDHYDTFLNTI